MSRAIDKLRLRLASLFRARRVEQTLKQEIELHPQEQIDEYLAAGMTPAEARATAVRAFGSPALIEEECRDTRRVAFVEHIAQDLRYTLRSLLRQPLLLAAAALTIGIAIAANTTIFSLASQLLFAQPSAFRSDRLVHIGIAGGSHVSHREWRALEERQALEGLTGFNIETAANWRGPDRTINLITMTVAGNFFDVVGVPMALGRGFTAREAQAELDPAVLVISHRFWEQRLGKDHRRGEPAGCLDAGSPGHPNRSGDGVASRLGIAGVSVHHRQQRVQRERLWNHLDVRQRVHAVGQRVGGGQDHDRNLDELRVLELRSAELPA